MAGSGRLAAESALRAAIADGDLLPGARLVEADLVAMLGVSRGNVRLAIDALAAEGLVERIPHRGARVRVISTDEAIAITEARMALEALIARKAAERVTDAEADRLRAHLHAMARRRRVRRRPEVLGADPAAARHGRRGRAPPGRSGPGRAAAGPAGPSPVPALAAARAPTGQPRRARPSWWTRSGARDADRAEAAAVTHFRSVIAALSEPTPDPGGPA